MQKNVIMSVDHLSKDFVIRGKKLGEKNKLLHALSDVSFDIYEGETLGIIGESGCGKSTLGRCLVKLHKPSAGTITYNGKDLWNMPVYDREAARRDIQMIFQDPYSSLDPRKTASYSIEEAMKVHHIGDTARERRQKALEYLQEVGLDIQHMERYPHEFSGGQRQRVNIARALSMEPKIIVCDEPVSALDVSIQAQVINLFRRLQKQFNLTYVFISHDLGIIKYISDRIMIMYLGRVMEFYTSEGIYADPKHPYTQALLSALIQAGHDDLLMHINPTTTPIDNFHTPALLTKVVTARSPKAIILLYVLYCRLAGTICGSTGEQNQFHARARSGKKSRSCAVHLYFTILPCLLHLVFIHRGASM